MLTPLVRYIGDKFIAGDNDTGEKGARAVYGRVFSKETIGGRRYRRFGLK